MGFTRSCAWREDPLGARVATVSGEGMPGSLLPLGTGQKAGSGV